LAAIHDGPPRYRTTGPAEARPPFVNSGQRVGEMREAKKRIRLLEQENEILRRAAVYLGRGVNPR